MDWFIPALAFALLHSIWQCALLAGAAWLSLRALRHASAALRHTIAMMFLLAMVLAPAAGIVIYLNADAPLAGGPMSAFADPLLGSMAAPLVATAWSLGASFTLMRYFAGYRFIAAMDRKQSSDLPPDWARRFERLREKLDVAAGAVVRVTDAMVTPCVTHILRPIIWIPASLLTRLPSNQLEALLAHELAHIVRKDALWNGVQNVAEALLFYHPAAYWLGKRARQEREHACDDLAVAACGDAVALAEGLAGLARARQLGERVALSASGGALLERVRRLLSPSPARTWASIPAFLGALVVVFALCAGQAGAGGGRPHDLVVEASTPGALGVGDYREITAHDDGRDRYYRASVDAEGHFSEIYRENGRERPIDASVRAWLVEVAR